MTFDNQEKGTEVVSLFAILTRAEAIHYGVQA